MVQNLGCKACWNSSCPPDQGAGSSSPLHTTCSTGQSIISGLSLSKVSAVADGVSQKVGDAFVLCDAGGGTVDLISYEITKLEPRLELKELVTGKGKSQCTVLHLHPG